MSNQQLPKVRLVRCPKCAKILEEPEHVPLYRCGGCNTILQVKYYKGSHKDKALSSLEQNVTRNNVIMPVRDCGESSGSSRKSSSSGENPSAQDEGSNQDSRYAVQNGDTSSPDHTSLSKESNALKKNGEIDNKLDQFVLEDQNRERDRDALQSSSYTEQNGAANSAHHDALSQESSFKDNKENKEIESKLDKFVSKDQSKGRDWDVVKSPSAKEDGIEQSDSKDQVANEHFTVPENKEHTMENLVIEDDSGHDGRCNGIVVENYRQKQIGDDNNDRDTFRHKDSQVLESKGLQQLAMLRDSTENGDDQHEQKQVRYLKSGKDASSRTLIESPAVVNPAEHHASDHKMSNENRKMHLVHKHLHEDQHVKQVGVVNSAKHGTSLTEAPDIEKLTQLASENLAEPDGSDHEAPEETRKMYLVGKYQVQHEIQQVGSVNSSNHGSSLTQAPEIAKPAQLSSADASGHEVSEETRKMHLVEKHSHQDQHDRKQAGSLSSAKHGSSLIEAPDIAQPTRLDSENLAERDSPDYEVSRETRKLHLVDEHFHQNILGNEISCLANTDEPEEGKKLGNVYGNETDPNDSVECLVERIESLKLPSVGSLATEIIQDECDDSVHGTEDRLEACGRDSYFPPSRTTDLKGKGDSKQNIENFGDSAVYTDSEVGTLLKDVPRSSTRRSPAHDGSVSSFDGDDIQVPEHATQVGREICSTDNAVASYGGAEESPEWTNIPSQRMIYRTPRVQAQERDPGSSSMPLDEKFKSSMIEEGQLEENGISRRNNRFRRNKDNFPPRVPYRRRSSEMTFETGSSSSYALHDEPPSHPKHHHPYMRRHLEVPLWREKEFLPPYYNYETSGEIYERPIYHDCTGGRRRAESWSQSGTLPRRPYSGEIYNGNYSYMHRYPDDRRWSAQLPLSACCYQGVHMGRSWETRWDPYDSYPISPPRLVESEASYDWGHDTISLYDDQRYNDQIMKRLYLREKRQALKRQIHPLASGAPFITCYFCFHILQLPKDFLLHKRRSRRRTHELKCGACSKILEFSLENEGCLAPCETNVNRNVNLAVPSHVHHSHQSSLNSIDGRELFSLHSFGTSGQVLHDAASHPVRGRDAKVTWQLPARSKSPLHSLMGYSSPEDLIKEREADDAD